MYEQIQVGGVGNFLYLFGSHPDWEIIVNIFGCEDRVAIFAGEDRELLADRGRSRNWYF